MTMRYDVLEIPVGDVVISPINVRQDVGDVSELADSIRSQGILEPLIARRAADGNYEVIVGARRLTAARQIGLPSVPVMVQDISDSDAIVRSLTENLQRGDLSLEERVQAFKNLQELAPETYGDTSELARVIGRRPASVLRDFEAFDALTKLRPSGIEIKPNIPPSSSQRREGRVIPEAHATMLEQAISAVRDKIPQGREESVYKELAQVIAPLEQARARRLLDEFKMYPDLPISEIRSRALATVQRGVTLPAGTARMLDELANETGQRDWGDAIARLVDATQAPEPESEPAPEQEPESEPLGSTETTEPTPETPDAEVQAQPELPVAPPHPAQEPEPPLPQQQDEQRPLVQRPELPEEPLSEQRKDKEVWNIKHSQADFYTVSYADRDIDRFVEILKIADVGTVFDVRHDPVSRHKPSFSKANLISSLSENGIKYVHQGDLGVPRGIRRKAAEAGSRDGIWSWYKTEIIESISESAIKALVDSDNRPVAFMCVEVNPASCHRHLLFLKLEEAGLRGYDL